MKLQIRIWLFLLSLWGTCATMLLRGQTVTDFPYQLAQENCNQWTLGKGVEWVENISGDGSFGFKYQSSVRVGACLSPEFDLSGLKHPILKFKCGFVRFYMLDKEGNTISSHFTDVAPTECEYELDKSVVRFKYEARSMPSYVECFAIREDHCITQFPYVLVPRADGWDLSGGQWGDDGNLISSSGASLTSPWLELPEGGQAVLVVEANSLFPDIHLTEMREDGSVIQTRTVGKGDKVEMPLSKETAKFTFDNLSELKSLSIVTYGNEMAWTASGGNALTLQGGTFEKGQTAYYEMPEIGRADKVTVAFGVQAASLARVDLSFQVWDPRERVWTDRPLTVPGEEVEVDLNVAQNWFSGKCRFKAVAQGGEVGDIVITDYAVRTCTDNPNLTFDLSYWYDEDRDGRMEYTLSPLPKGMYIKTYKQAFYKITDDGAPVKYKDFPDGAEYLVPYNVNNDAAVDYVDASSRLVFTGNADGGIETEQVAIDGVEGFLVTDYDNNGLPDLILTGSGNQRTVLLQMPGGSFMPHAFDTYTREEYLDRDKTNDEWAAVVNSGSSGIVSQNMNDAFLSGKDMFIGGGGGFEGTMGHQASVIDFNKDGMPDIVDAAGGNILLYMAEDKYVTLPMGGSIYFRDLNNDQLADYVVYEPDTKTVTAHICRPDGTEEVQQLISNLSMDRKIWCYDLDKDGDVDILLPFSYLESNGASFLVVMENDGNGHFKMHEMAYDGMIDFKCCADVDGDGYYDVLAAYSQLDETTPKHEVLFLKGDGKFGFDLQPEPLIRLENRFESWYGNGYGFCDVEVADIDHDGFYDVLTRYETRATYGYATQGLVVSKVYPIEDLYPQARANAAPERPVKPSYYYEPSTGLLKVHWVPGRDMEASGADLTYALRIGTRPGEGDIFYAHAMADGTRLNLLDGNMGHDLDRIVDASAWNAGKYYIAIQAIDPMHSGSAWSEEAVFEKGQLPSGLLLSDERTVCDTLTLALAAPKDPALDYQWDLDGATVLSQNEDASVFQIRCDVPGEKRITLRTGGKQGGTSSVTDKAFFIFANRIVREDLDLDPADADVNGIVDMDNDGLPELLTSNGVYESDGKGHYNKLKKIYNTNLAFPHNNLVIDLNRDGLADVVEMESYSVPTRRHLNQGDKVFATEEVQVVMPAAITAADFDHDGLADVQINGEVWYGDESFTGFSIQGISGNEYRDMWVADMDRDGFHDLVSGTCREENGYGMAWYRNTGGRDFVKEVIPIDIPEWGMDGDFDISGLADMDNDGYMDLVVRMNDRTLLVAVNDRNQAFNRMEKFTLPQELEYFSVGKCFDYDNNGFTDIAVASGGKAYILYFYANWETEVSVGFDDVSLERELVTCDMDNDGTPDWVDYRNRSSVVNTPPQAPAHVHGTQANGYVTLKWDAAKDAETPSVRLRYNLSVKRTDAEGEGAYAVSPMNGGNEMAAVVPTYYYPSSTTYSIPLSALSAGTYEVRVQAIDAWNAVSPFSETYQLKVESDPKMELPSQVYAKMPVEIRYTGNLAADGLDWDWDGGRLISQEGQVYSVKWVTEGLKHISVTCNGVEAAADIYVNPAVDASFTIGRDALANASVPVELPEGDYELMWEYSKDGGAFVTLDAGRAQPVSIVYDANRRYATATFSQKGKYVLRLTAKVACGEVSCERNVTVTDVLDKLQIDLVSVDQTTGRYAVSWKYDGALPDFVTHVKVYKEGNRYNDFCALAAVPVGQASYIDMESQPQVKSSRYRLSLCTEEGIESGMSEIHQGVHVMLNKGLGNAWNLTWNAYEGAFVDTYRILRGTSPEQMAVIAEVAGSVSSYTDWEAPNGCLYYALDFAKKDEVVGTVNLKRAKTAGGVRSNVVSTEATVGVSYAESISIYALDGFALSPDCPKIRLAAEIYPLMSTFRKVNWSITEGTEIALISADGAVSATGNGDGKVIVRAFAIDGSDAYAEAVVTVTGMTDIEEVQTEKLVLMVFPGLVSDVLHIRNLSDGSGTEMHVDVFDINGIRVHSVTTAAAELDILCSSWPSGMYILKVSGNGQTVTRKFMKK